MIFVSVGTQLPFDRLIRAMDQWSMRNPNEEVFAQVGETNFKPNYMTYFEKLSPKEYDEKFKKANCVISHVGMGTIITGLDYVKPMILMPRLFENGEHRNNHQLGTAEKFQSFDLINIVNSAEELYSTLNKISTRKISNIIPIKPEPSEKLLNRLRNFVERE